MSLLLDYAYVSLDPQGNVFCTLYPDGSNEAVTLPVASEEDLAGVLEDRAAEVAALPPRQEGWAPGSRPVPRKLNVVYSKTWVEAHVLEEGS